MGIAFRRYTRATSWLFSLAVLMICATGCRAQQRSTNIQTIDGRKYYIHKVEKQQSMYGICRLYNVTQEELIRENPTLKEGVKTGMELRVPFNPAQKEAAQSGPDTSKYQVHKVEKGETVYSISRKYNLTDRQLAAFNPGIENGVKEGQLVIVGEKKKKNREREKPPVVTVKDKPQGVVVDSSLFLPMHRPSRQLYNVALMLPFKLDEAAALDVTSLVRSNADFPAIPTLATDFYLGFRKAVDSLASKDFSVKIALYDIDEKDTARLNKVVNDPRFSNNDMIFGPLYASGFRSAAKRAAELRIPMISPITQQNKILFNNIYVSKTNPSQFTLLETLADYCVDSLLAQNVNFIVALSDRDKREAVFVQAFRKYFNDRLTQVNRLADSAKTAKGIAGVRLHYKPGVKNVVLLFTYSQVIVVDFITQLAVFAETEKKDLTLCGWESLTEMENLDQEYLNQLHYTFAYQFNTTNLSAYRKLNEEYKSKMETYPGEYFYLGFDIGLYYLKQLKEQGPDFVYRLDELPLETGYMRFRFSRPDKLTGYDNRGVYIFRYSDYELRRTGWK
jgi:LysM repeat protein/ABC-type branched-subunit amino acid transport system substrate-binding protein